MSDPPVFKCRACGYGHPAVIGGGNKVWDLPGTITTKRDEKGNWRFCCVDESACQQRKSD